MWVCACVCVYTRIDICTYVCVHTYMHAHIYIHVCIHRYLHIEMHARKYICMPIARNRLDCGDEYLRDRVATAQRKRAVSRDIVRSSREVMPERRVWTWARPRAPPCLGQTPIFLPWARLSTRAPSLSAARPRLGPWQRGQWWSVVFSALPSHPTGVSPGRQPLAVPPLRCRWRHPCRCWETLTSWASQGLGQAPSGLEAGSET